MRILAAFFFSVLAMAVPSLAKTSIPETATPAVWVLKNKGGDITFLGSIHLLPPSLKWRTPPVDQAVKRAEVIVFEAPVGGPTGGPAAELMTELGSLKDGKTLQQIIPPALWTRLEDAAWTVRFPSKNLERFEPWMASVTLDVMLYVNKGFSPWSGVDMVLEAEAQKSGKKLQYLETVEEQLGFLANLPRAIGIKMLESTILGIETKPDLVDELVAAWAKGDPALLWSVASDSMDDVPEVEEALLKRRNAKWIPKLEAMIKTGKPHLVIVGAAHLAGPDSVITTLRTKGYRIEGP